MSHKYFIFNLQRFIEDDGDDYESSTIKAYSLADGSTETVNSWKSGIKFNEGMGSLTKAIMAKLNSTTVYSEATSLQSGLMSANDKIKLDGIDTSKFVTVVSGKGLSTEDYTTAEKEKLASLTGDTTYDFDKKITLESGFTTTDSVSSSFGNYSYINVKNNSTVQADNSYVNISQGYLVLTSSEVHANNVDVVGLPTFTSGFKTADSVNSNFGTDNHVNLGRNSRLALGTSSTIDADHSYIDLSHGEIRLNYSKLTFDSTDHSSITGDPNFTGTPVFNDGFKLGSDSKKIKSITITDDGKLQLVAGASTYSFATGSGDISYSEATSLTSGLMSSADKIKLDGIDTSKFVTVVSGKQLSTNDYTTTEKNKLAALTVAPTFSGTPNFKKGLKLGSDSSAIKSMTINDDKLQIVIGSKTYTFTPDSSTSTPDTPEILLTPSITFNPSQLNINGVKPYSFSYTITSDATYHSFYYTDSRYPNWRYPDDYEIIVSGDDALSDTRNDTTIPDPDATTDSGTITYYITVPETDHYEGKTFTYSVNYTNC